MQALGRLTMVRVFAVGAILLTASFAAADTWLTIDPAGAVALTEAEPDFVMWQPRIVDTVACTLRLRFPGWQSVSKLPPLGNSWCSGYRMNPSQAG